MYVIKVFSLFLVSVDNFFCFVYGNKGAIKNIDKTLKMFDESSMDKISPTTAVNKAKKVINRY